MPESPSSSFIPKRGVGKKPIVVRKSNFVLLSIISYALFAAAPLASAAVFIYERHTQNQFNKAVVNLDQAIENFKEEDLRRVTEFNERLMLSKNLLAAHVSISSLLTEVERATAQTVVFKSVDITRVDKSQVTVTGLLETEKFDGAIFQRSAYSSKEIIQNPVFSDVILVVPVTDAETVAPQTEKTVEFKTTFMVSAEDILYVPQTQARGESLDSQSAEASLLDISSGVTPAEDSSSELDI